MKVVADTSAILAVLLGESSREAVIAKTANTEVFAPASLDWEVGNALSALLKRRALTKEDAISVIEAYGQISIQLVEVDIADAVRLASQHGIYAYDAYVLQCAVDIDGLLLTLDKRMAQVAQAIGIKILEVD